MTHHPSIYSKQKPQHFMNEKEENEKLLAIE